MHWFNAYILVLIALWQLEQIQLILNAAVSFCRFPIQEWGPSFALTKEVTLIQKAAFFRFVVVNVLMHIRMQYRYGIKGNLLF